MKSEIKAFEAKFDSKVKEVLVLTQNETSASRSGKEKMWRAGTTILAMVDVETGELMENKKRLVWLMTDKHISMKNKLLLITLTVLITATFVGCGAENTAEVFSVPHESIAAVSVEGNVTEENSTEDLNQENSVEKTTSDMPADLTFADLSKRQFEFSSGAGAWSENFTIEKDGYFTGKFHDSDMGDNGEGYADGTIYSSSYSGHFTDLTKVNNYTYKMKLADISYEEQPGTVDISANIRWSYTDSYCLDNLGTDTYTIYLPGTPLNELSEEVCSWLFMANGSGDELTMIAIVDENMGFGIYSYDRLAPLEDAQMNFDSCKTSYDYYGNKLSEANTTLEMVECTGTMYEISDDCLNYIWNLIRYNVDEDKFDEILAEQREWIAEKEARAKEAGSVYEGGSLAAVGYNDILAEVTMKRCEELIEYLK